MSEKETDSSEELRSGVSAKRFNPFVKIKDCFTWYFSDGWDVKSMIKYGAEIFPVIVMIISGITTIVAYIAYIAGHGYKEQIAIMKKGENIYEGAKEALTTKNVDYLLGGKVLPIVSILLVISVLFLIARIISDTKLVMRIIMIIDSLLLVAVSILPIYVLILNHRYTSGSLEQQQKAYESYNNLLVIASDKKNVMIYVALTAVAILTLVILSLIDIEMRFHLKMIAIAGAAHFIVLPLLLLLLENIVPLFIIVVVIILVMGVVVFCLSSMTSKGKHDVDITLTDKNTGEVIGYGDGRINDDYH